MAVVLLKLPKKLGKKPRKKETKAFKKPESSLYHEKLTFLEVSSMFYKIIFTLLTLSIASTQIIATSIKDILSGSEYEYKKIVIPTLQFDKDNILKLLTNIKRGDFDSNSIEDLDLDEEKKNEIKDFISEKLKLNIIKNKIFNSQLKEDHPFDIFAKISSYSHSKKEKVDELIKEFLLNQQKSLLLRVDEFIKNAELITQNNPKNMLIFVLPEAFFNYFNNPDGIGNFIPFSDKDIFFNSISTFSYKNKNTLFVGNFVYADKESQIDAFLEDFNDFSICSYNQSNIIKNHNAQRERLKEEQNPKMIPIFNESFILFQGKIIVNYKKRFILDEDIPLEYLNDLIKKKGWSCPVYTPGNRKQKTPEDFYIEICQDHAMIPDQDKKKAKMFFVQSATINVNPKRLQNIINGLLIHSDIQPKESEVFSISSKKQNIIRIKTEEEMLLSRIEVLKKRIEEAEKTGLDYASYPITYYLEVELSKAEAELEGKVVKKWMIYDISHYLNELMF
jgi:hypothetical protein